MRLRIVEVDPPAEGEPAPPSTSWREIASQRVAVRLGHDVFLTGTLAPAEISAACEALSRFRELMNAAGVDRYRAVATSAAREAKNGALLVERAEREAGIILDVIEGVEEARLVHLAIERRLGRLDRSTLLVDIGGGSTELTVVDRGRPRFSTSLALGTVRLLEAFLDREKPVSPRQGLLVREYVERQLAEALPQLPLDRLRLLLGTGGNIETLAQICPGEEIRGLGCPAVDVAGLRALLPRLMKLTPEARAAEFALRPDRADVIVPAAAILLRIAELCGATVIGAPGVGLKEGVLEELCAKHFARWDWSGEAEAVAEACLRLGRRYHFDEAHGLHVARLALRLFDQLRKRHGLGDRERLLLNAAALLHDVGDFVRYEGHHKHSCYIIEHSDLMGLTPLERTLVANVARYHRKSPPDVAHANFRELDREGRKVVRTLAAILRLADALDREHLRKVDDVRLIVERGTARLELEGGEEAELEAWTLEHKAGLFREVFDLGVTVVPAA